jgi:hypothetical protein
MNANEALEKAVRVLQEEELRPTLSYRYVSNTWPRNKIYQQYDLQQKGFTPAMAALVGLQEERTAKRPRYVYEDPKLYFFESTNFALLIRLLGQVREEERAVFVSGLLECVRKPLPKLGHKLLAEFLIRAGYLKELLEATEAPQLPAMSLAYLLNEIEEMMALNFNLFSDAELESIPKKLSHLRNIANLQTYSAIGSRGGPMKNNPHYKQGYSQAGSAIVAAIDGIEQECGQGRYWYLKGVLQELPNLEIESDRVTVQGFLVKLGFSGEMLKSLNAAGSDYKSTATTFELKNCLGHLRSFLEHLHREAAKSIAAVAGDSVADKWGEATVYLRQQGCFTLQHERFSSSLYTVLSDESVHPLTAEREYARLLRNVVIEYGVMFLTVLDKRGVKI